MKKIVLVIFLTILFKPTHSQTSLSADSLNKLSEYNLYKDNHLSHNYAAEALSQAKKENDTNQIVKSFINISNYYLQVKQAGNALDSLYKGLPYINYIPIQLANELLFTIGNTHHALKSDSITFKNKVLSFDTEEKALANIKLLFYLTDFYTKTNNLAKAAESIKRAEALSAKVDDSYIKNKLLLKKGIVQFKLKYYERALNSLTEAETYFSNPTDSINISICQLYIGEIYYNTAKYSLARTYLKKSLQYDIKNTEKATLLLTLAKIAQTEENHNQTISLANQCLKLLNTTNSNLKPELFYIQAGSYYSSDNIDDSMLAFDSCIFHSKEQRDYYFLGKALYGKSNCYSKKGDLKKANYYLKNAYQASESNFENRIDEVYAKENAYYNNVYQSSQIQNLRKDQVIKDLQLQQSKTQNRLLYTILAAIIIVLTILLRLYLQNRRFNLRLKEKNRIIDQNNTELQQINNALTQSQLSLLKTNKVKDRMFSIITHDIKGTLLAINAQIDYISFDETHINNTQYLNKTKQLLNTNIKLLNHHIKWAVSQTNEINVNKESISIESIINRGIELYEGTINKKEIKTHIIGNIQNTVQTDIKLINLVFRNILSNAIKHTPNNGIITIETDKNGNHQTLSISDEGEGLSTNQLETLFKLKDAGEDNNDNNSGTGLYLSHRFIKALNGNITAKNNKDKGCTFTINIPL